MKLYIAAKHAKPLTAVIQAVCDKYSGLPREVHTLLAFENALDSEVYKYLYVNDGLEHYRDLKADLKGVSKLLDPYRPAERLEVIGVEDVDPVEVTAIGTFV